MTARPAKDTRGRLADQLAHDRGDYAARWRASLKASGRDPSRPQTWDYNAPLYRAACWQRGAEEMQSLLAWSLNQSPTFDRDNIRGQLDSIAEHWHRAWRASVGLPGIEPSDEADDVERAAREQENQRAA
jgi:hypothetical protein